MTKANIYVLKIKQRYSDVGGMALAEGIITATGGFTSHASVVARAWGKPCVCGATSLDVDEAGKKLTVRVPGKKPVVLGTKDWLSINGDTGEILLGQKPWSASTFLQSTEVQMFMSMADKRRKMKVFANGDSAQDAREAILNGAEGIGLVNELLSLISRSSSRHLMLPLINHHILQSSTS